MNVKTLNSAYVNDIIILPINDDEDITLAKSADVQLDGLNASVHLKHAAGNWIINTNAKSVIRVNGISISYSYRLCECDYINIGGYQFFYQDNGLVVSRCPISCISTRLECISAPRQEAGLNYPEYLRSTRLKRAVEPQIIEILPPKATKSDRDEGVFAMIMSPLAMLALTFLTRSVMGNISSAIYTVSMTGSSLVVSLISYNRQKKRIKQDECKRVDSYNHYIQQKKNEIALLRKNEADTYRVIHRSLRDSIATLNEYTRDLFDRSPSDDDFLYVTLGQGSIRSIIEVQAKTQDYADEDDTLSAIGLDTHISDVSVTVPLLTAGAVGVHGDIDALRETLKIMVFDIALRHIDSEVQLFFIFSSEEEALKNRWTFWLPHTRSDSQPKRNIICDDESRAACLESLYALLSERDKARSDDADHSWKQYVVVFVADCDAVRDHPVSSYFENSGSMGVVFIFMDPLMSRIPKGCTYLIKHHAVDNTALLIDCVHDLTDPPNKDDRDKLGVKFTYERIDDETALRLAIRLSPIYVVKSSLEKQLTRMTTLFQTLGIASADYWDVQAHWRIGKQNIHKTIAIPLGATAGKQPLMLDLHEKGHGPHGLIAGTTGSGKSELLLSLVMSLAAHYSPEEIGFIIIDFKGEGLIGQIRKLPHLLGAITNLDGSEVTRSLRFIKAETVRRQHVLKAAGPGVKDITTYLKTRQDKPELGLPALPHLIIIVDEFAELAANYHDFLQELNSTSRIGRSLGVHLILATQKPQGIITPQIDSNSRFRLCLKVQSKEDSMEVIHTPIAAEIRETGRAYLKVGGGEVFELFQSAYASAELDTDKVKPFTLYELNAWGKQTQVYPIKDEDTTALESTQVKTNQSEIMNVLNLAKSWDSLSVDQDSGDDGDDDDFADDEPIKWQYQALMVRLLSYCDDNNIIKQPMIVLAPLPRSITLDKLSSIKHLSLRIRVPIGLADDPDSQWQDTCPIEFYDTHWYIVGSSQSGKTVLVKTLIAALAMQYTPRDVAVYIIDMGKGIPLEFEQSLIIGGIVYRDEETRMQNLFYMLETEIERRRNLLSGVGSHKAYLESGKDDLPFIIFIVDGFVALREQYEYLADRLRSLSHDAVSAGVFLLVTSTRGLELNSRTMGYFGQRVALFCNNSDEYANMFDRCRIQPKETPGRGLIMQGKRILEFQTALPAVGKTESQRNEQLRNILVNENKRYSGTQAHPIPMVPDTILLKQFTSSYGSSWPGAASLIPAGLAYNTVQPYSISLTEWGIVPLIGRTHSGRTNFMRLIICNMMAKTLADIQRFDIYITDDAQRSLSGYENIAENYSTEAESAVSHLISIIDELKQRMDRISSIASTDEKAAYRTSLPILIQIVINPKSLDEYSKNDVKKLIREFTYYAMYGAALIINLDNIPLTGLNIPDIYKVVQDRKRALYFDAVKGGNIRMFNGVNSMAANRYSRPTRPGDMYPVIDDNIVCKVRTILAPSARENV
ncbi:type VII secretion protein EssC [Clostridia bacterium]|nr:type VII secretion protein EssC [Clostridia bacterium]